MMSLLWERKLGAQGNEKQEEIGMLISSCMCVLGGERKFPPKATGGSGGTQQASCWSFFISRSKTWRE